MGSTTKLSQGVPTVIAKAHHGSVSKEKRLQVEHELKTGQVPCVVATSSLELGIDMGSIDLVLQVAAPPSVASGLQRIGRANHRVGGRSEGAIYPRTRTEIVDAAVVAEGMEKGLIEETALIRNPLDVLSQQTVAAVALGEVSADAWYETVCRAAPFSELPRRAFDSVLDLLAGRHASTDLSELSPRIVWDRTRGMLVPRPGTQRHAVMTAGTIPDRGMFSVVLPEGGAEEGRRRVGELDEEMVYESRVGDVIALGTSSWRIREITRDRVIVEPAPGRSARLPFWHGEGAGRPAETGKAKGAFLREVARGIRDTGDGCPAEADDAVLSRLGAAGLDTDAQRNLIQLLSAQRAATGIVPDDKTLVVERCEDEVGDWRVLLHSPYGRRVHEPWAMAVADRVMRTHGFDPQATAVDDGIILRIPAAETRLPGAELFAFDPDELDRIVRGRVGSTALFAARFRECATRALLMPPAAPGKRMPLWQQRLRAGQLLEAARQERDFPLLLETARECLQDVYDMPSLHMLMEHLQAGTIHLVEKRTSVPSPFAAPLLFGYVGEHLYQGDLPHAERRASLLSLDPALLGELLGTADMAELLDPSVIHSVEDDLQRISLKHRVRGTEGVADLLRVLGPLSVEEVAGRLMPLDGREENRLGSPGLPEGGAVGPAVLPASENRARAALEDLRSAHRAFSATVGGEERWLSADDAGRAVEALGIEVPPWAPPASTVAGAPEGRPPLDDLVVRHARTHGPFSSEEVARRFGLGRSVVRESLDRLAAAGMVIKGRFGQEDEEERPWVAAEVFRRLRSLSLAKARRAVRAVDRAAFVRFLFDLQGIGAVGEERLEGIEGTADVIAQFEGVFLPVASWESQVLPSRVRDYRPSMLDELLSSGEILWVGDRRESHGDEGPAGGRWGVLPRGWGEESGLVAFFPTDSPLAPKRFDPMGGHAAAGAPGGLSMSEQPSVDNAIIEALSLGGGLFFDQIAESVRHRLAPQPVAQADIVAALGGLTWSGQVTNDTFAPARFMSAKGGSRPAGPAHRRARSRRSRLHSSEIGATGRSGVPARAHEAGSEGAALSGRWSLLVPVEEGDAVRGIALVDSLLDRYGVLSRDVVALSDVPGGMAALFPVLRSMEDAGEVLRGVFVEGFGPAQFAARETIDLLRTYAVDMDGPSDGESEGAVPSGVFGDGALEQQAPQGDRRTSSGIVVLAADDPACLFGAGIPWPSVVEDEGNESPVMRDAAQRSRPSRRSGGLVAVSGGIPVLYATAGLRSLLAFTADAETLAAAVDALVSWVTRWVKSVPGERARKKILVETFNGHPVLSTSFADLLHASGFVRLPDGMRLYVLPF